MSKSPETDIIFLSIRMKFKMTIMERCTCFLGDSVIVSAGSSISSMWSTSLIILYELIVEK
jgi:hypothetical protein